MNFYTKPRFWLVASVIALALLLGQQFWQWEIERVEVGPQKYLVRIHRWGKDLPEDDIVAPDDSYKGVMLEVGQEGRHFLNPIFWTYELHDMVSVPAGKCLVQTRKFGRRIPKQRLDQGDFLAGDDERGILKEVLYPGNYRLNPYAFSWEEILAVQIGADQVGVRTLKVGKDPRGLPVDPQRPHYVVPDGYRGVQATPVVNGTYYINPYVETITPVEVRSHRTEFTDIEFPCRDGFILKPHVTVEYQVQRNKAPELLVRLCDEGKLHQDDGTSEQQEHNEILQKVILPHIRGLARMEGSNYYAHDFILADLPGAGAQAGNTRERLEQAILAKIEPRCQELGIRVRAVRLGQMTPPTELSEQISARDLARVQQDKNKALIGQYKEEQKLKSVQALKQQNREKVEAQTKLLVAKTNSEQRLQVEELRLKQELANAQVRLDAARSRATAVLAKARAEAAVTMLQNEAEVAGLRKAIQGFSSVAYFAQYHVLTRLAPALREIFVSDDSDFAKLFSNYISPPTPAVKTTPVAEANRKSTGPVNGSGK